MPCQAMPLTLCLFPVICFPWQAKSAHHLSTPSVFGSVAPGNRREKTAMVRSHQGRDAILSFSALKIWLNSNSRIFCEFLRTPANSYELLPTPANSLRTQGDGAGTSQFARYSYRFSTLRISFSARFHLKPARDVCPNSPFNGDYVKKSRANLEI